MNDDRTPPAQRQGPRASWLLVVAVVITGATTMGWVLYELLRRSILQ